MSGFAKKLQQKKKDETKKKKQETKQEIREKKTQEKREELKADQAKEFFESEELARRKFLISAFEKSATPDSFLNPPMTLKSGAKNPLYLEKDTKEYQNRKLFTDLLSFLINNEQHIRYLSHLLPTTNLSFLWEKNNFSKENRKTALKNLENIDQEYLILDILHFMKDNDLLFSDNGSDINDLIVQQSEYLNDTVGTFMTKRSKEYANFVLNRITGSSSNEPWTITGKSGNLRSRRKKDWFIDSFTDDDGITWTRVKNMKDDSRKNVYASYPKQVSFEEKKPWISNYEATYVYSLDLPEKYFLKDQSMDYDSKMFYKATSLFDDLMKSSEININHSIITIQSDEGVYHAIVLYKRRHDKNILLDEEILRREKTWLNRKKLSDIELASEILDMSQNDIPFLKQYIESQLSSIDPNLSILSERILQESKNVKDVLEMLSKFTLCGKGGILESVAIQFNRRLKNGYYYYQNLFDLPLEEMLQEYYRHPDNQTKLDQLNSLIEKYMDMSIIQHAIKIWCELNNQLYEEYFSPSIQQFSLFQRLVPQKCSNPYNNNVNSIVYFLDKDDLTVYCFTIESLVDEYNWIGENPFTGKSFPEDFLNTIDFYYNIPGSDKSKNPIPQRYEEKEEKKEENDQKQNVILNAFFDLEKKLLKTRKKEPKQSYIKEFYDNNPKITFQEIVNETAKQ